ncbi:MAG: sigma-54 dependent transcriptional regulator [Thermodesulfovibrionales bacterium]
MKNKAKVFVIDDDALIVSMIARALKGEGHEVLSESTVFSDIVRRIKDSSPDIVLLDISLAGRSGIEILEEVKGERISSEVIMLTSDDRVETAVKCMKLGAVDYLTKPFNLDELKIIIRNLLEKKKLRHEVSYLRKVYSELFDKEIIGGSAATLELNAKAARIARARVPSILITGESGTGKELVARCIHGIMHGECSNGCAPFVAVNCTALPEHLLESELFGHEKGAFTDAKSEKKGLFELADGGTVLLDEIGDMRPSLQSKLLRVLEERTLRRIGGREEIPVEVTVIATTNRDLSRAVDAGDFRLDLLYRLNTFSLSVPPLREKREDIPALARHFLGHFAKQYNNRTVEAFSPEAEQLLCAYDWPGNVRELRNVIERIVVLESSELIQPQHLPLEIAHLPAGAGRTSSPYRILLPDTGLSLEEVERELFQQAMEKAKGNRTLAAKLLQVSYDTLRYHIKKFRLDEHFA